MAQKQGVITEFGKGKLEALEGIVDFIDSMQEEPISEDKMTISKEWFEHCKKSWYNEGYIDGEYNRDRQFEDTVSEDLEKAADKYSNHDYNYFDVLVTEYDGTEHWMDDKMFIKDAFIEGAKWKEQQFETEGLKHCELKKELISDDLDNASFDYAEACKYEGVEKLLCVEHFKAGSNWQKEHLWKPSDGDDLPEIDREVIALLNNGKVVFAHRPPKYWDGKDIVTGKVTRNYPKTYGKGGWNIPNLKYWLDYPLPE